MAPKWSIGLLLALIVGALLMASAPWRDTQEPLVAPFVDTQGHWAAEAIEQVRLAGLTAGCSETPPMFCPDRPLTRAEAAVLLARLLDR